MLKRFLRDEIRESNSSLAVVSVLTFQERLMDKHRKPRVECAGILGSAAYTKHGGHLGSNTVGDKARPEIADCQAK